MKPEVYYETKGMFISCVNTDDTLLLAINSVCGGNRRDADAGSVAHSHRYDYAAFRIALA